MRKSIALASVALSAALLISSAASAGTNLVQNGSFETTTDNSTSHEFGASFPTFGQDVTGWTSASTNAFNLYFTPGQATGPTNVPTRFSEQGQFLWVLPADDPDGGNFVALDGDTNFNGPLTQTINNLTAGAKYVVSFDWATAQYADRTGDTTEQLQVGFGGGLPQSTAIVTNPSKGATAWQQENFTFTATGASQVLSFLSIGAPAGQPPVALLDGVSVTAVPEPAAWAMMLVGFGGLGAAIRRRRAIATA